MPRRFLNPEGGCIIQPSGWPESARAYPGKTDNTYVPTPKVVGSIPNMFLVVFNLLTLAVQSLPCDSWDSQVKL
jgi:hypothetical protein